MKVFLSAVALFLVLGSVAQAVPPNPVLIEFVGTVVGKTGSTYNFDGSENYWTLHELCRDEVDEDSHWCSVYEVMNTTVDPELSVGKAWVRSLDRNFRETFRQNCNGFDASGSPGTMWTVNENAVFNEEACPPSDGIGLPLLCCEL